MNDYEQKLLSLISRDPDDAAAEAAGSFQRATQGMPTRYVIYGGGACGTKTVRGMIALGLDVVAVVDAKSALWGSSIAGVPVMSLADAAARFGESATLINTVWNIGGRRRHEVVHEDATAAGFKYITQFVPLYRTYAETFLPHCRLERPECLLDARESVLEAFHLFADDDSRREYVRQVQWLLSPSLDSLGDSLTDEEIYFLDLMQVGKSETLLDGGAYTGDTLRQFLAETDSQFQHVHAFEPDPKNWLALNEYVSSLPEPVSAKISLHNLAIGNEPATLKFSSSREYASMVSDTGDIAVECVRLDDYLTGPITFLKLDIESYELEAMAGAAKILERDQPKLAICAYHHQDHLWEIPLAIHRLLPNHAIYMRHHGCGIDDAICYALPAGS